MVNDIVKGIDETLKRLEKVAKRYEILGSSSKGKHFWVKFKWSFEFSSIDGLRNKVKNLKLDSRLYPWTTNTFKLVYHNTMMNLLLTSVGKYDTMTSSIYSSNC